MDLDIGYDWELTPGLPLTLSTGDTNYTSLILIVLLWSIQLYFIFRAVL
jgi:hypothetical protein